MTGGYFSKLAKLASVIQFCLCSPNVSVLTPSVQLHGDVILGPFARLLHNQNLPFDFLMYLLYLEHTGYLACMDFIKPSCSYCDIYVDKMQNKLGCKEAAIFNNTKTLL